MHSPLIGNHHITRKSTHTSDAVFGWYFMFTLDKDVAPTKQVYMDKIISANANFTGK